MLNRIYIYRYNWLYSRLLTVDTVNTIYSSQEQSFKNDTIPYYISTIRSANQKTMPNISKISRNLCVLSVTIIGATCSSDFHNNNNNNINSPYLYSEIQSLDFDIYDDESNNENEILNLNSDSDKLRNPLNENNYDDDNESYFSSNVGIEYFDDSDNDSASSSAMTSTTTSIVASTISYDGDYFVSSQAMVCNGGGSGDMNMNMNMDFSEFFDEYDDDEEASDENDDDNDDDSDDDNDGHSSMLSNNSLRRSTTNRGKKAARCYASGGDGDSSSRSDTQKQHQSYGEFRFQTLLRQKDQLQQQQRQRNNYQLQNTQQHRHQFHYSFLPPKQRVGTTTFAFLRDSVSAVAAQMIEQRLHPKKLVIERKVILN